MLIELYSEVFIESSVRRCEGAIRNFMEMPEELRVQIIQAFREKGKEGGFGLGFHYCVARGVLGIFSDIHCRQKKFEWIKIEEEIENARQLIEDAYVDELESEREWHEMMSVTALAIKARLIDIFDQFFAQSRMDDDGAPPVENTNIFPFEREFEPLEENDPKVTPYIKHLFRQYQEGAKYGRIGIIPIVDGRPPTDEELLILQRLIGSKIRLMGVIKIDKRKNISPF